MELFNEWLAEAREIELLRLMKDFLEYDELVNMPPGASAARGEQKGLLAVMRRARLADPRFVDATDALLYGRRGQNLTAEQRACLRGINRDIARALALPAKLVAAIETASSDAVSAWLEARRTGSFSVLAPHLATIVGLKRQQAQALDVGEHPYDSLLDEFEPGMRTSTALDLLRQLAAETKPLLDRIKGANQVPTQILDEETYDQEIVVQFGLEIAKDMGFDFNRGRMDRTAHPMCMGFSPDDVRFCGYKEPKGFRPVLLALIHEVGHGLYEQGFDPKRRLTPMARAASYGVHESQSRFWEMLVAGSLAFWTFYWEIARERFPHLQNHKPEDMFRAINKVEPSFIRVQADPLTYGLHILLRTEIEAALMAGEMRAEDVPDAWNEGMERHLGIRPRNAKEGCLQDVHWASAYLGYFPSYAIGNLMAVQLWEQMDDNLGTGDGNMPYTPLPTFISQGDFAPMLDWLRRMVHCRGEMFHGPELIREATGKELSVEPFMRLMTQRYTEVYHL